MRRVVPFLALTLIVGVAVGCDGVSTVETDDPNERPLPEAKTRLTIDPGLEAGLSGPDTVEAADSFAVQVAIKNNADRSLVVQTPNSCLVRPAVYADGERVLMEGSNIGCLTAVTQHEFDARETRTRTFDMQAVREGEEDKEPVSPGYYSIRVSLDWKIDEKTIEDTLTAPFYVSAAE